MRVSFLADPMMVTPAVRPALETSTESVPVTLEGELKRRSSTVTVAVSFPPYAAEAAIVSPGSEAAMASAIVA